MPSFAGALEVDAACHMRLALTQAVGAKAAKASVDIFGTPATVIEKGWLAESREASDSSDPRLTATSRATLRGTFGKFDDSPDQHGCGHRSRGALPATMNPVALSGPEEAPAALQQP